MTPEEFKDLKPQFSLVPDATVQQYLDLAAMWVGDSFPAEWADTALAAMACHLMTLDGLGTGAEAESFLSGAAQYQSVKTGNVTLTRYQSQASGQTFNDWLGSTTCGRFLWQLMRRLFAGPRVAMGGIQCGQSGYAKDVSRLFWWS